MRTDDLIDVLAAGLEPARPVRLNGWLLAAASGVAAGMVGLWLGVRPDLGAAVQALPFWLKGGYTVALGATAFSLATRLGRPAGDDGPAWRRLACLIAIAALWAVTETAITPSEQRLDAWLGRSWASCSASILLISAATTPLVFVAARRFAPIRPMAMGAALGLVAGSIAATAYGLLYCTEAAAAFVVCWYTVGVLAAGVMGGVAGRLALRW